MIFPPHIDPNLKYVRYLTSKHIPPQKTLEGRKLCKWCLNPLSGRRQSWCSDTCVEEFLSRTQMSIGRCWRRDKGICVLCGSRGFEVDHVVPVVEGGGCCTMDNLRVLCKSCHRKETNILLAKLKLRRKENKIKMKDLREYCNKEFGW